MHLARVPLKVHTDKRPTRLEKTDPSTRAMALNISAIFLSEPTKFRHNETFHSGQVPLRALPYPAERRIPQRTCQGFRESNVHTYPTRRQVRYVVVRRHSHHVQVHTLHHGVVHLSVHQLRMVPRPRSALANRNLHDQNDHNNHGPSDPYLRPSVVTVHYDSSAL